MVEIHRRDGWLVAELQLKKRLYELCRMISPPKDATLRVEILELFNQLAGKIVESIIRDDQPDIEFELRRINMPRAGNG